jgi:Tfp pilus assembly PilM family ATPase
LARFLALDWDHNQLHVIAATITRGNVRIQHAQVWQEADVPNPANAEGLGKLLRERLRSAGIAPAPVLACVGRDRVIIKDIRYPNVPAAEEPGLVRFQAMKELTDPPNEVVIDYTAAGQAANATDKRAFALIVRRELLATYQTLCQSAGLKLAALTPRLLGASACFQRLAGTPSLSPSPAADTTVGLLTVGERWAEFVVLRGGAPVFARSLTVGPGLAGEVKRNLAFYAGQSAQNPVQAVYLAGTADVADLRERLQNLLGLDVFLFDPFAGTVRPGNLPATGRGGFAGALGLLYLQAAGKPLPINFVKVKEAVRAQHPHKRLYALAACAVVAALLGGGGLWYSEVARLDREIATQMSAKSDLDGQLAVLEDDDKRIKALTDWTESEVVWLDELYDLTDRFPDDNSIRMVQLIGEPVTRTAKSKYIGKLALKGVTTDDHKPVDTLMNEIAKDSHLRLEPKFLKPNVGQDRRFYTQEFTTKVDIERLQPAKYARRIPELEPFDRRNRGRPQGNPMDFGFFGVGQ